MKELPVVHLPSEEYGFPIFTDIHCGINLFDAGGETILGDRASVTFHVKLLNHPVVMTWKNTAVSLYFVTLSKTATYHKGLPNSVSLLHELPHLVAQGCNLEATLFSGTENPCHADRALQTAHYSTSEYVCHAFGRDVIRSIDVRMDAR